MAPRNRPSLRPPSGSWARTKASATGTPASALDRGQQACWRWPGRRRGSQTPISELICEQQVGRSRPRFLASASWAPRSLPWPPRRSAAGEQVLLVVLPRRRRPGSSAERRAITSPRGVAAGTGVEHPGCCCGGRFGTCPDGDAPRAAAWSLSRRPAGAQADAQRKSGRRRPGRTRGWRCCRGPRGPGRCCAAAAPPGTSLVQQPVVGEVSGAARFRQDQTPRRAGSATRAASRLGPTPPRPRWYENPGRRSAKHQWREVGLLRLDLFRLVEDESGPGVPVQAVKAARALA